jgi:4-hydroxy-L-threonine phosphate dehydrogenase PdxA
MERNEIIAGISNGDINGIGYEIIIKTLNDPRINEICIPVVYGSPKVAAYHRKALDINNFTFNTVRSAQEAHPKKSNMINCLDDEVRVELGKPSAHSGEAAYKSLKAAVSDLKDGNIDVLVTAPIDKHNIQSDDFRFPGHTEYLKEVFGAGEVLMLMVSENMKIGTVTGHLPLSGVPGQITEAKILAKLRVLNRSLSYDFGIRKPRIAVLALNPHAGDNGLLGSEEKDVIAPAIEKAVLKIFLRSARSCRWLFWKQRVQKV